MKKCPLFLLIVLLSANLSQAQSTAKPKLVIGLMVDQMRWDFLYKYSDRYSTGGFRRLLREGFSCENAMINYTPSYTAAGHASVYTGSVPSLNGIMGNNWYDRTTGKTVYCTDDSTVVAVGSNSVWGKMSPRNLWSNTITDELRISSNFRSKTIAIALKDRGAILPGGHTANAAYWFDNTNGNWISSTFYMNSLPDWVNNFNSKKRPDYFLKQNWNTLYPITTYTNSTADAKAYENVIPGEDNVFPHKTDTISKNIYESFRYTPFANTFCFEMAEAAIENEKLGARGFTDFLALSLSSPDYIGHAFGPNSIEIEDTYLRLDKDLAAFLTYLDKTIGKNNYLLFITADHGVAHASGYMKENKLPAGNLEDLQLRKTLNDSIQNALNIPNAVSSVINYQVYLNYKSVGPKDMAGVKQVVIRELMKQPAVAKAFDLENIHSGVLPAGIVSQVANGYNQKLSGDVQFLLKPQFIDWGGAKGTTHGSPYPYDVHIPLVFFGWNIKPGHLNREVNMTDIAATLAAKLHIQMPNACVGKVIEEVAR
jgi:predicted AlkP superfamily pyrophosphatase or phosphodiesterase